MIQFAIIGCGQIAASHAKNIQAIGKLAAVCDVDKNKADAFAKRYDANAYYSIEDLLLGEKEVTVVCICTPSGFHAEHSIKALQASKHVLCESPLCLTTVAAWQMIETEKFCRQKLFVVETAVHNKAVKALKEWLLEKSGAIQQVQLNYFVNRANEYFSNWQGKLFPSGGALFTEMAPLINALLFLFGNIKSVKGSATRTSNENKLATDKSGEAIITFENGTTVNINWSLQSAEEDMSLCVMAENGTIKLNGAHLENVDKSGSQTSTGIDSFSIENEHADVYKELYQRLKNTLENRKPFATALDALPTVQAIESINKAVGIPSYHSV